MKALTILLPFAQLIAVGAKKIETRSWKTNYRGPLAIHAGKTINNEYLNLAKKEPFRSALKGYGGWMKDQDTGILYPPPGCVIAIVDQIDCLEMTDEWIGDLPYNELAFGWYDPGRYGHIYENVRRIEPIPAVGHQGLWNWEPTEEVKKMLGV